VRYEIANSLERRKIHRSPDVTAVQRIISWSSLQRERDLGEICQQ
jgi:hypothetical protein